MRARTVRNGLRLVIVGICAVLIAAFFHGETATLLSLSSRAETRLVYWGLFLGGAGCGLGIVITMAGLVRHDAAYGEVHILPTLILLLMLMFLMVFLFYRGISAPLPKPLKPGETIVI